MKQISCYINYLDLKGNLTYEYHPFHNFQTNENLQEVETSFGKTYIPEGKAIDKRNGLILDEIKEGEDIKYINKENIIIEDKYVEKYNNEDDPDITKDSLMDLETRQLNFDLLHPVDIEVLPSYDGSVNLILNDNKNIPRLINSRFSVREKNTYEIVDRIGENDTNIYSSSTFDKDTSLYFLYKTNPKIEYRGLINGTLSVGNYCFYFTYCDADDNESDFIAETGAIPIFIGSDKDPNSIDGGIKNQNSCKGIKLKLKNLDSSYNYLKVYYIRYFADYLQNRVTEGKKILLRYSINSKLLTLQITGEELTEDIDPNILNISKFNPKSILTQTLCKNMLFFGNIVKNTDNYKELLDCALRIIPTVKKIKDITYIDKNYILSNNTYYNSYNMYNKVGYYPNEYYRFGIVFIYENGTLSNVYNTLGYNLNDTVELDSTNSKLYTLDTEDTGMYIRNYIKIDNDGWVINNGEYKTETKLNSRGVCKIPNSNSSYSIEFKFDLDVINHLKKFGIRGFFFVRQKRVPNIIAQCYILPMDPVLLAPIISTNNGNFAECFVSLGEDKTLVYDGPLYTLYADNTEKPLKVINNYTRRLYKFTDDYKSLSTTAFAGICPDFLLNQPYYNQIFNGGNFTLSPVEFGKLDEISYRRYEFKRSEDTNDLSSEDTNDLSNKNTNLTKKVKICSVTEDVKTVALNNDVFRLEIGAAEEAFRFRYVLYDKGSNENGETIYKDVDKATNIVRGIYSPYLAISGDNITPGLYNIYQEDFIDTEQLYLNRMNSYEPFYAISDRYNFEENLEKLEVYRGDCYLNTFTYRLNRNFNDSSLANNDKIIDVDTWRDNYKSEDPTSFKDISRSDVNAVLMGSWITFEVMSSINYALRSEDNSYVSETALMGAPRSFFPRKQNMWIGNYKKPDSYLYNDAFRTNLGYKCYFTLNNINYIKNSFTNRIQYSAIAIQDSFKNNYRESLSTYYRDYSMEYGSILKLIEQNGNIVVVFEHGIGIASINERILAGEGSGGEVFINTKNVLPEELNIITNSYGTLWGDSVIKSELGYIYGVDTIAKKIWRLNNTNLELISDFKVNKFLIDNITISERELYPKIGIRNVKTHYNNNKKDIIFTFYDDVYKDEENVWSICYNELLGQFTTFYSWVPSFSENIDTQFFTFDRNTSKILSAINYCNYSNYTNEGVLLNTPILNEASDKIEVYYRTSKPIIISDSLDLLPYKQEGELFLEEIKDYKLLYDHYGMYNCFELTEYTDENENKDKFKLLLKIAELKLNIILNHLLEHKVIYLTIQINGHHPETVAITSTNIINNLTTDFYLHGNAGIFDVLKQLLPTHWYEYDHPFEFEFVVNDKIGQHKLFSNLEIISNKAEPESFHFEIEGEDYEFASDKRTMYFRQEATKNLYLNMGLDILYDRKFIDVKTDEYTLEQYYRTTEDKSYDYNKADKVYPVLKTGLVKQVKSTIFPLYYEMYDSYDEVYRKHAEMIGDKYDFKNLSGSEIKWNRDLNLFDIVTHIKNNPINLVGRLRGNSIYKDGKWLIQIPSISYMLKNEKDWVDINETLKIDGPLKNEDIKIPPIVINSSYIPKELKGSIISYDVLPNIYRNKYVNKNFDLSNWTYRKEAKIRDKWIKVRIRYSGKNLAIIHSILTLYNINYN